MEPDQLRRRIAASRRVLLVAAAAVRRSARDILGIELSRDDAMALAQTADLESTLHALNRRLSVKRPHLTPEENLSLSAQEIALRQAGGPEADVRELISRTVEEAKSFRESQRLAESHQGELRELVGRYENQSPELRKFLRKVKRLWRKREMTVTFTIPNSDSQRRAISELNGLFVDHIDEALASVGLREP